VGLRGWASTTSTGSSAATRTSFTRRFSRTTRPVSAAVRRPELHPDPRPGRSLHQLDPHAARDRPDKPFFLYFAPGNSHAPHHASKDWIAKFKGQFDQGWDKVREETLRGRRSWASPENTVLTAAARGDPGLGFAQRRSEEGLRAMMEVYAATVAQSDHEVGRILDALAGVRAARQHAGHLPHGDNGASAEGTMQGTTSEVSAQIAPESIEYLVSMIDELGGEKTYNHYPDRLGARDGHSVPMDQAGRVAPGRHAERAGHQLPKGIKAAGNYDAVPPCHRHRADDPGSRQPQAPRLLNGTPQKPMEGVSMAYTFDDAKAPDASHDPVFRDVGQPRDLPRRLDGLHHARSQALGDSWRSSRSDEYPVGALQPHRGLQPIEGPGEENPKKLLDLQSRFLMEAVKYNVLPIDSSFADRMDPQTRPNLLRGKKDFTYYPG
jgi:arylsulfatase